MSPSTTKDLAHSFRTPLGAFYYWEQNTPDALFLNQPLDGTWERFTYRQAGEEIRKIAGALSSSGVNPGSHVAILSKNCAHWIMADLAIWMAGCVSVPIYPTLSASGVRFIIEHSAASAVFVGKLDDYATQREGIPIDLQRICFAQYGIHDGDTWNEVVASATPITGQPAPDPKVIASIMYSSGTTGDPKGVMLSFQAFDFVGTSLVTHVGLNSTDRFFSYLPMSHIAEKAYVEMGLLYSGGSVSFAESLEKFPFNLQETQPTVFGGVPRIYAKFQQGVLANMPQKKLETILRIPVVSFLIKKIIRKKLGLAKAHWIVGGAAPIPVALLTWFRRIGIVIQELYGMTEDCGFSHGNHSLGIRIGTVGKTWPNVECRIAPDHEIQIRHPGLMTGYFKDPDTTASVFTRDGFLRTGDQGSEDADGYLTITGRVNDQFKTEKGKFIVPASIEMSVLTSDDVEQVLVVGNGLPQPLALIVLSAQAKETSRELLNARISKHLAKVNSLLERFEKIQKVVVLPEDWSIENGRLTPSLKVRRKYIESLYHHRYADWYQAADPVVWE